MEKRKSNNPVQTTTPNGNTEVFVLTPEILAKLGINIQSSQIQSPAPNLIAASDRNAHHNSMKSVHEDKDETSIIETASLMKASVFLSPTFHETTSNVIPEVTSIVSNEAVEINISSSINNDNIQSLNVENEAIEILHHNINNTPVIKNNDTSNKELKDLDTYKSVKEDQTVNQDASETLIKSSHHDTPDIVLYNKTSPINGIRGTSNISEGSHKKFEFVSKKVNPVEKCDTSNKVKIISEQVIVDFSQLKEIKNFKSSNDATLIPITVDTLVTGKTSLNKSNYVTNDLMASRNSIELQTLDHLTVKNNSVNLDNAQFKQILKMTGEDVTSITEDERNEKHHTPIDQPLRLQSNHHLSISHIDKGEPKPENNNFIMTEQKKNTIKCLSDDIISEALVNKTYNGDIRQTEIKTPVKHSKIDNGNLLPKLNSETDKLIFSQEEDIKLGKTPIQNDEVNMSVKILKTYERTVTHKQIPTSIPLPQMECLDKFQLPQDIHAKNTNTFGQNNDFCICYDFGNLVYYDCEVLFDHIHFDQSKNVNCELEVLFSIYNENYVKSIELTEINDVQENLMKLDEENLNNKCARDRMCWNCIILEKNDGEIKITPKPKSVETSENCSIDLLEKRSRKMCDNKATAVRGSHIRSTITTESKKSEISQQISAKPEKTTSCSLKIETNIASNTTKNNKTIESTITSSKKTDEKLKSEKIVREKLPKSNQHINSIKRATNMECEILPKKVKMEIMDPSSIIIESKNIKPVENLSASPKDIIEYTTVSSNQSKLSSHQTDSNRTGSIKDNILNESFSIKDVTHASTLETGHRTYNNRKKSKITQSINELPSVTSKSLIYPVNSPIPRMEPSVPIVLSTETTNNNELTPKKSSVIEIEVQVPISDNLIKCGVCNKNVEFGQWWDHICKEHNYLAWRHGEPELNLEDEELIRHHLQNIAKQIGGLVCPKCGLVRKFAKKYRSHVMYCGRDKPMDVSTSSVELNTTRDEDDENVSSVTRTRKSRVQTIAVKTTVTCGVCAETVIESSWIEHIKAKHNYLAWKDGEKPIDLNSEEEVKEHLNNIAKHSGLVCNKCGSTWRYVKKYLLHQQLCLSADKNTTDPEYECGVCHETGDPQEWTHHAMRRHYNIAWKVGETPIDLQDFYTVDKHLRDYQESYGKLVCKRCEISRTTTRGFYAHILTCGKTEQEIDSVQNVCEICNNKYLFVYRTQHYNMHKSADPKNVRAKKTADDSDYELDEHSTEKVMSGKRAKRKGTSDEDKPLHKSNKEGKIEIEISKIVKCGVCKADVAGKDWINHIQEAHAYLAWVDGEEPLELEDQEKVRCHLSRILNTAGELVCNRCGESRRHEHGYSQHVRACDASGYKLQLAPQPHDLNKDEYECGVCKNRGRRVDFKKHAMNNHYNIAWMAGEKPINMRNPYAVEKYLKEYKVKYPLVCKLCKTSRTSCYGFYAHILQCGKSEAELDEIHNVCEICNQKYLCIYRNQHMATHKYQEWRKEEKVIQEAKKEEEKIRNSQGPPTGKRKAAEKANQVIKKHTIDVDGSNVCSCGMTFNSAEEVSGHRCRRDSDVSVKMEPQSEESESEVDYVSGDDEEMEESTPKKQKRPVEGTGANKITRMHYRVANYVSHLTKGYKDFVTFHYSTKCLFNTWRNNEHALVPPDEISKYLPTQMESCKLRFGHEDWKTYKRFESIKSNGFFTGGAVQCMSWSPTSVNDINDDHYLAVVSHLAPDVPRCTPLDRPTGPALLQIWHFGEFTKPPKLSLALALDYGVVWAMDWCPSGARDPRSATHNFTSRLGLVALACSDGNAYIFAVPYPPGNTDLEQIVYKLKPVAKLSFSMTTERRTYQATSINWSQQKGHEIIIVGYSDGNTALYDLNTQSPLLKTTKSGVTIIYPFQDRMSEDSVITGAVLLTSCNTSQSAGAVGTGAPTGGTLRAGGRGAPAARCHLPAAGASAAPLWPALNLYGDAAFSANTVTELEWWGGGRRLGAARAGAACVRCGRTAALSAPAIRLLRANPVYPEIHKLIVATLLMVPFDQKGSRKRVDDDISLVVEPLSYDEAVSKYGLELSNVSKKDQLRAQKLCAENETRPERFPLSELVAAAFCPSSRFHDKLAVASHAGFIFIIHT